MLDQVGLPVSDRERSKRVYAEALSPLGYELISEHHISGAGFRRSGKPDFWIREGVPAAVHEAAIAADGRDNGRPGLRPEYHPIYYGAYVLDPDGNNIEAVCRRPGKVA